MNNNRIHNIPFLKDFSWYFLGTFIPLFIGFIKTPIFTRHFTKEDYGYLGLVGVSFTYLGMVLFSWIGSCLWRYFERYSAQKSLIKLYTNLGFLYLLSFILLFVISITWFYMSVDEVIRQLIFFFFFQILLNQLYLSYMVIMRLKRQVKFYTLFQSIKALLSVVTALILVFVLSHDITALVSSLVLIELISILILIVLNPAKISFHMKFIKKSVLKELASYGSVGLILNLALLIISSSDRYVIFLFGDIELVGIYDQVYKLCQIFVVALVTIYFNTINPILLKELEQHFDRSMELMEKYIQAFIIFGLPIIFYLSFLSEEIARVFLGKDFRSAYMMMPFIFLGAYLQGFSNFHELRMKFSNKLKRLSLIVLATALLNIILNIIFVGLLGYKWASVTTAVSYVVLLLAFNYYEKNLLHFYKMQLFEIIFFLTIEAFIFYGFITIFDLNIYLKLLLIFLLITAYYVYFRRQLSKIVIPMKNKL